eukprot:scaffold28368_cov63-Phaeocystis_antarctica.AAC.4
MLQHVQCTISNRGLRKQAIGSLSARPLAKGCDEALGGAGHGWLVACPQSDVLEPSNAFVEDRPTKDASYGSRPLGSLRAAEVNRSGENQDAQHHNASSGLRALLCTGCIKNSSQTGCSDAGCNKSTLQRFRSQTKGLCTHGLLKRHLGALERSDQARHRLWGVANREPKADRHRKHV